MSSAKFVGHYCIMVILAARFAAAMRSARACSLAAFFRSQILRKMRNGILVIQHSRLKEI